MRTSDEQMSANHKFSNTLFGNPPARAERTFDAVGGAASIADGGDISSTGIQRDVLVSQLVHLDRDGLRCGRELDVFQQRFLHRRTDGLRQISALTPALRNNKTSITSSSGTCDQRRRKTLSWKTQASFYCLQFF